MNFYQRFIQDFCKIIMPLTFILQTINSSIAYKLIFIEDCIDEIDADKVIVEPNSEESGTEFLDLKLDELLPC